MNYVKSVLFTIILVSIFASVYGAARFSNNIDGTVMDNGSGLLWQKCSRGQNAHDCSGMSLKVTWYNALNYCNDLNLAGKSWRLPSINELKSIVDYSVNNQSINEFYFPNTATSEYWSSSTYVVFPENAWIIDFSSGRVAPLNKTTSSFSVRCVADGP